VCLLTFLPAGVHPDTGALFNGAEVNEDGHGFAIVTDRTILVQRGMDAEQMIDAFAAARREHPHGPAMFHSRFSTHGEVSLDNCHPFAVGADARTVVAHNGVLPANVQPVKGDPRSDTRIAAEMFLPTFGALRLRATRKRLERWMTPANKMAILTVDPRFRQRAYLLNEDEGMWHEGIWYSNDGYLPYVPRRRAGWWGADESADRPWWPVDECQVCLASTDPTQDRCPVCGWCLLCGELPDDCFCYTPAVLNHVDTTKPTRQLDGALSR